MKASEEKYLLALAHIEQMNQDLLTVLMEEYGSAEEAWRDCCGWPELLPVSAEKISALMMSRQKTDPGIAADYAAENGIKVSTVWDDDFPSSLRNVYRPPFFITYLGKLPNPDLLSVSVVGARKCTDYGKRAAANIVTNLVKKANVHIVSGMAEGIDGAAHRAALAENGVTTAVLGCGIDVIYPHFHKKLYGELRENGCIISEFPFGMPSLPRNFPFRNRLISGLSDAVLVVQGEMKSGTLHTVKHGLEQGKNIYAMPGEIDCRMSELPHWLIETGQAKFAACAEDILEDFIDVDLVERLSRSDSVDAFNLAENAAERSVVLELEKGRRGFDELAEASGLSSSELTAFLTRLELEGAVSEAPGNFYTLINQ